MFSSQGVGELESIGTRTVQKVCFFFAGNARPNLSDVAKEWLQLSSSNSAGCANKF